MTEGSFDDGNYLVRVRAQVMTRDDIQGGWFPMGGGGLSNVSVCKRLVPIEDESKHEYFIYGKRISDQSVVLSCIIRKDFQYNKVMPTFHHWRTGDNRFGLTFQTAADARAFDKGVRMAVEDLDDVGNEDVFMTLELPMDSLSSSGSSTTSGSIAGHVQPSSTNPSIPGDLLSTSSSPYTHPHANYHHLHRMHFMRSSRIPPGPSNSSSINGVGTSSGGKGSANGPGEEVINRARTSNDLGTQDIDKIEVLSGESYSYVQFAKDKSSRFDHEYSYPVMDPLKLNKQDCVSACSYKKPQFSGKQPSLLPTKNKKKHHKRELQRQSPAEWSQCRYCREMFDEEKNYQGSCEYAFDPVLTCINASTCMSCAQCMLYHCVSDVEGEVNEHTCSCNTSDDQCCQRWIGLALLSFLIPCLWCYLPLRACHHCGLRCHLYGGRHRAT
ncbi:sprouty-related, EVH1 domain-containing protein 2-like isoform X2 [Limulus polyphemus]|uniref:Sprouty-related, EVH1 domain-containing protein 2-like isoform X2 n=1 Tax=Limulus polyphemus TaxID=6850 RepID=A0ABM1TMB2_LIMPO|nr:sprouty-related, EVH1 domain-containing protein 2-like isoform X2 [Limulus polyphemus]